MEGEIILNFTAIEKKHALKIYKKLEANNRFFIMKNWISLTHGRAGCPIDVATFVKCIVI